MTVAFDRSQKLLHKSDTWAGALSRFKAEELLRHLSGRLRGMFWSQSPQIFVTEFSIHRLHRWNIFPMNEAFKIKLLPHIRSGSGRRSSRTPFIIDWLPSVLQTFRKFTFGLAHYRQMLLQAFCAFPKLSCRVWSRIWCNSVAPSHQSV